MTSRLTRMLVVLFGLALPAASQLPDSQPVLVESIVVEGVRSETAREIVTVQSLLLPGREYTEEEIRHAVYRIKRLPFVLDADYSLRAGNDGEGRQLVVEVEPNRALFASVEVSGATNGEAREGDDRTDWSAAVAVGGRMFVGSRGLLSARAQGFDSVGPYSAGVDYTQYGLFGRGASARVEVATNLDRDDGDIYFTAFSLDVPLVGDHSLRADLDWYQSKSSVPFFQSRSETKRAALAWVFDTTNDPLFPTVGQRATGGVRYSEGEQDFRGSDFPFHENSDAYGFDLGGRRHWALTPRQSVSAALSASWDRATSDTLDGHRESSAAILGFGHSADLLGGIKRPGLADFRWENTLQVVSSRFESPFGRDTSTDARFTTGVALRNAWGLVRLNFSYVDNLDRDFKVTGGVI